ncbi:MAG TPA: hypothetical protein VGL77_04970 [Armatimonadota bacterium]
MRKFLLLLCCCACSGLLSLLPGRAATTLGPFLPNPALTLYLVADGKPTTARITVRRGPRAEGDRLMIRAFDPEERLSFWQYLEPGQVLQPTTPGDGELFGIPLQTPIKPQPGVLLYDTEIPFTSAGVHQLRVTTTGNSLVTVTLSRPLDYGVSFQNGTYSAWDGQPATCYAYIPPHAEEFNLMGGPVTISDEKNAVVLSNTDGKLQTTAKAPISKTDTVWKIDFPNAKNWALRAWGFPIILCPTPQAARTIHASVEVLPDGTVVCHKFQRRIAELLPKLLAPENVGKAEALIVPLTTRKDEWLKDPVRNSALLHPYGSFIAVDDALRHQNVDPLSHWSGASGSTGGGKTAGWLTMEKLPAPQNRWDRFISIPGLWAGASAGNVDAEGLALAATLNVPCNPYYGKKELLNRAAAIALRDLMTLGEDETWRGVLADNDPYPGAMAFPVGQKTFPAYALAAPFLPAEIRDIWTDGLRHIVDRGYPDGLVSCRNQSSHFLVAYEEFAKGSGDPRYADLALAYGRRFVQGLNPAGFAVESMGADATYNGMSHWHMGVYYRETNDPYMAAALRKSYRFFNHTVAPEPDGAMLGASNFAHRTSGSFNNEQWGGARGIADDLPEVGLWAPRLTPEQQDAQTQKARADLERAIASTTRHSDTLDFGTARYLYAGPVNRTGIWPAQEKTSFLRDLDGELVAVKRPGYYTAIYVGKPAPVPHYISYRENFRLPLDNNVENGGEINGRKVTPFLGGGLSLVATPSFGNALLAMNWAPTTHNGLVATQADGKRYWEDYFATRYVVDQTAGTLTITGKVENQPLTYTRQYQFNDNEIIVHVTLTAQSDLTLTRLVENFPFPVGTLKTRGITLSVTGETDGHASADRFQLRDQRGAGIDVLLDSAHALTIQRNGPKNGPLQIGRVEIELPAHFTAGQRVELSYRIQPVQ